MGDRHDYVALDWVKGEIEETLKQARQALEAYAENPQDSTKLRFCLNYIHQVHGTLQMVEFYGAALLAEEMEALAKSLLDETVSNKGEAHEVLMQAMLQLPMYLDRVQSGRRDLPVILLPILNDIRAARGESLLSETSLFSPDLSQRNPKLSDAALAKLKGESFNTLVRKLRQMYQFAMVGILRDQHMAENLGYMAKVFNRLEQLFMKTPLGQLWWIASGVIDGLNNGSIHNSSTIRALLRQIDIELKRVTEEGPESLNQPAPDDLLKNLLYYVAKADNETPRIRALKEAFNLVDALPDEDTLNQERDLFSGPDKEAMASVVTVLTDELTSIKEALDLFVRSDRRDMTHFEEQVPVLKRIADTIAVLGLGIPRKVLMEQLDIMQQMVAGSREMDDAALMDIAGSLLYVEATLTGIIDSSTGKQRVTESVVPVSEMSEAHEAVIREARNGLEQAKDAIIEFIASQWNHQNLLNVPEVLDAVRGGLVMIPLERAATLIAACRRYVKEQLLDKKQVPQWQALDTLADAITSVEYYLERLSEGNTSQNELILDVAEESLVHLGFSSDDLRQSPVRPEAEVLAEAEARQAEEAADTSGDEEEGPVLKESEEPEALEEVLPVEEPEAITLEEAQEEPEEAIALEEVAQEMPVEGILEAPPEEPVTVTAEPEPVDEEEESLIDDEVIEIFIEEAGEVLETINEYLPKWQHNLDDADARGEVRRAFHTLKGSGRLVGATVVGELAWAIENMLNRVIDNTISISDDIFDLARRVTNRLPGLVKDFENKQQKQTPDVDAFIAEAEAYAKGLPFEKPVAVEEPAEEPLITEEDFAEEQATLEAEELTPSEAIWESSVQTLTEDEQELPAEDEETKAESVEEVEAIPLPEEEKGGVAEELELLQMGLTEEDFPETEEVEVSLPSEAVPEFDPVLLDIFHDEAVSHFETLKQFVAQYHEVKQPIAIDEALQRALHTLKGSAHMAGVVCIAQLVSPLEQLIKDLRANLAKADQEVVLILQRATDLGEVALASMKANPLLQLDGLDQFLHDVAQIHKRLFAEEASEDETVEQDTQVISMFLAEGMEVLLDAGEILEEWSRNPVAGDELNMLLEELETLAKGAEIAELDPVAELCEALIDAYKAVVEGRCPLSDDFFKAVRDGHEQLISMMDSIAAVQTVEPATECIQQLHRLTMEQEESIELAEPAEVEEIDLNADLEESLSLDEETLPIIEVDTDIDMGLPEGELETLNIEAEEVPEEPIQLGELGEEALELSTQEPTPVEQAPVPPPAVVVTEEEKGPSIDPELVEIFLEEAGDIMESTASSLQKWIENPESTMEVKELQRDLHTLKGGARMAEITPIGDFSHELEFIYEGLSDGRLKTETPLFDLLLACHDLLADMLDELQTQGRCRNVDWLIDSLKTYRANPDSGIPNIHKLLSQSSELEEASPPKLEQGQAPSGTGELAEVSPHEPEITQDLDDLALADTDVLDIFLEEAVDLVDGVERSTDAWRKDPANGQYADELLRLLHTLKGGARLAGLSKLGDFTHEFEMFITQAQNRLPDLEGAFFADVFSRQDQLQTHADHVKKHMSGEEPAPVEKPSPAAEPSAEILPFTPKPKVPEVVSPGDTIPAKVKPISAAKRAGAKGRQPQEMVKVPADLLESLVNLAGETSISRGRVEQQISDISFTLEEMHTTIERVREQLRRLDIETQTQIISKHEAEAASMALEFDPLEMDQYSELTQLSRSLFESASDLMDLKEALVDKNRDAETLLLQQARVNTELQEGLMQTRMVPFNRLMPRLRRIVRQISSELDKQVEFNVENAEGEMDRTVLERMVAPLEHMLRNAVDHGIESEELRKASGKDAVGQVTLSLSREGGDILLEMSDDGSGVNLDAVRAKAIERGLMDPEADLSDNEILQFILEAGFSTARAVTQISGRGVGMDVVHSEIKQLGGSVTIHSAPGKGTTFRVRLPFTVSVNRALMVYIGEDLYAIPLNSIEGVVRVSPYELEAYYEDDAPDFEYAGQDYKLKYLGDLLHRSGKPNLQGALAPLPVILTRGAEHSVALQVDSLAGSREIVVKSLGFQFASLPGVSGATILGDGRVVIILDVVALIRSDFAHQGLLLTAEVVEEVEVPVAKVDRAPLVMVVDDSVTVRKVTSRLLERNGYEVLLARDGVEAISLLQDRKPDVMLLDIEMPRMDGFEVASTVRNDRRLKSVPIIMITSRTGEKHRERALAIGVNEYLGKPFQEGPLLETIERMVKTDA
ncbi:Hpt domain-containing protein [Zooshikella harenae]|uniref:histidine kinase n=1 Tax=Zooshikella harenae TaxID=2827238 RepID=A0ABS5Z6W8_9GAMM|nr:Hpt domain-containing protein [Zooshikella harenae]MBU2709503.1 Hpt domain-containing protein [Zooshikella harenae]